MFASLSGSNLSRIFSSVSSGPHFLYLSVSNAFYGYLSISSYLHLRIACLHDVCRWSKNSSSLSYFGLPFSKWNVIGGNEEKVPSHRVFEMNDKSSVERIPPMLPHMRPPPPSGPPYPHFLRLIPCTLRKPPWPILGASRPPNCHRAAFALTLHSRLCKPVLVLFSSWRGKKDSIARSSYLLFFPPPFFFFPPFYFASYKNRAIVLNPLLLSPRHLPPPFVSSSLCTYRLPAVRKSQ